MSFNDDDILANGPKLRQYTNWLEPKNKTSDSCKGSAVARSRLRSVMAYIRMKKKFESERRKKTPMTNVWFTADTHFGHEG